MKNLFSKDVCFVSNSAQSTMNEFINGLIVYLKLEDSGQTEKEE